MQSLKETVVKKQYVLPGNFDSLLQPKSNAILNLRRWYRHSLLRLFAAECGNLGHRIGRIQEIREAELGCGKEEVHQWRTNCAVGGPDTHDYIAYMQRIEADHPFLSIFDKLLLSQAWRVGWESGVERGILHNREDSRA